MLRPSYPYFLANEARQPNASLTVTDKFTGQAATQVALADEAAIAEGIAAAQAAEGPFRAWPPHRRQAVLEHCVARFRERFDELAMALCVEAGKPIRDSRGEVGRLIDTFKIAAEESVRLPGEIQDLGRSPRTEGYTAFWKRVPLGACSFISPFNFPLNLAAHKVAPALAAGCPFVLKPASLTPVGALIIGEVLAETDLPRGVFSILPCERGGARLFTEDPRLRLLSFTGSPEVGWDLKARAGKKKVVLELGGNAAVLLDADTDLGAAIPRVIFGAFYQSGQSCIGVQRILVHASLLDAFREQFVEAVKKLPAGDPKLEDTFIGPMISEKEAARLEGWIRAAEAAGARILCGGGRQGAMLEATVLENVPLDQPVCTEEAFGPVAVLSSFTDFREALRQINDSKFGLQAGIFTRDLHKAHLAWDELEVGGVVINDVPSWRADAMPYGGVKDSGLGREGIRWAIEDMTELRLMVVKKG
ncbi:MAG: aldehyde dehydrogenase family protein [Acidobacteria bacterium]|nr:aldehyde dehydrogenase family protein [Acidobacteriota bacterium]